MNILYIDDNPQSAESLQNMLSQTKYTVFTALDARDGFHLIPQIKPNIILLDLDLPIISGLQALSIFRNTASLDHIPLIAVHDEDDDALRQEFFDRGGNGFLRKPIDKESLLNLLVSVMQPAIRYNA